MSENKIGPWIPVSLCNCCGIELGDHVIFYVKVCPNCAATAVFCLAVKRTAKRWVQDFKPTLWQRCQGQKSAGHWEWSGKGVDGVSCVGTTDLIAGRRIAGGMNTVTIAAAGIASGLF